MTVDRAIVSLQNVFEYGQAYGKPGVNWLASSSKYTAPHASCWLSETCEGLSQLLYILKWFCSFNFLSSGIVQGSNARGIKSRDASNKRTGKIERLTSRTFQVKWIRGELRIYLFKWKLPPSNFYYFSSIFSFFCFQKFLCFLQFNESCFKSKYLSINMSCHSWHCEIALFSCSIYAY